MIYLWRQYIKLAQILNKIYKMNPIKITPGDSIQFKNLNNQILKLSQRIIKLQSVENHGNNNQLGLNNAIQENQLKGQFQVRSNKQRLIKLAHKIQNKFTEELNKVKQEFRLVLQAKRQFSNISTQNNKKLSQIMLAQKYNQNNPLSIVFKVMVIILFLITIFMYTEISNLQGKLKQNKSQFELAKLKIYSINDLLQTKYVKAEDFQAQNRKFDTNFMNLNQNLNSTVVKISQNVKYAKKEDLQAQNISFNQKLTGLSQNINSITAKITQNLDYIKKEDFIDHKNHFKSKLTALNQNINSIAAKITQNVNSTLITMNDTIEANQKTYLSHIQEVSENLKQTFRKDLANYQPAQKLAYHSQIVQVNKSVQQNSKTLNQKILKLYNKMNLQKNETTIKLSKLTEQSLIKDKRLQNNENITKLLVQNMGQTKQALSIPLKLLITTKNQTLSNIRQKIKYNQIYQKLDLDSIKQLKANFNNVVLTINAHKLVFDQMEINFARLAKSTFTEVQYLWFKKISISTQQLEIFLLNLNQIFPNLKFIKMSQCQLNDAHWDLIVEYAEQLQQIQALILHNNKIQWITPSDLQKLQVIDQLKYLDLRNLKLTRQTIVLLAKHKQDNQQIDLFF